MDYLTFKKAPYKCEKALSGSLLAKEAGLRYTNINTVALRSGTAVSEGKTGLITDF